MLPLATTTVVLLGATKGIDPVTGNDVLTYPDPEDGVLIKGSVQPQSSTENVSGREEVISTYRVFLPGSVALKATDRLLFGDLVLEVDGAPEFWPSPFGGIDHIEANTLIVTG